MTKFFLIRHGETEFTGQLLVGRKPGVNLNDLGRRQATLLADKLASAGITRIFTSPLERAIQTAAPLAFRLGLQIQSCEAFNELDFGDWTGRKFGELESLDTWRQWNSYRGGHRAPNGETMLEVQARFVLELQRLRRDLRDERIAVVSHGDPLRSALIYYLGMPMDNFLRLEISTASFSMLSLNDWGAEVRGLNIRVDQGAEAKNLYTVKDRAANVLAPDDAPRGG